MTYSEIYHHEDLKRYLLILGEPRFSKILNRAYGEALLDDMTDEAKLSHIKNKMRSESYSELIADYEGVIEPKKRRISHDVIDVDDELTKISNQSKKRDFIFLLALFIILIGCVATIFVVLYQASQL